MGGEVVESWGATGPAPPPLLLVVCTLLLIMVAAHRTAGRTRSSLTLSRLNGGSRWVGEREREGGGGGGGI